MESDLAKARAAFDELKKRFHSAARVGDAIAGLSKDWFVKEDCVWCTLWPIDLCLWCKKTPENLSGFGEVERFFFPRFLWQ